MKKNIWILCILIVAAACNKDKDSFTSQPLENKTAVGQSKVPSTFTQKLLMEMYSTVHCATCPDAEHKHRQYANNNPGRVYGVCVHTNDAMASTQFPFLDNLLNITQFSSGSFNRLPFNGNAVIHKTSWTNSIVSSCLNKTAKCGLKINTYISGNVASASVLAGFNQTLNGDYRLTVYLVEDSITGTGSGYDQANYYNNIQGTPWYQLGDPIVGYNHDMVLRKVLSAQIGDAIPSGYMKTGGCFAKNYSFNISGYDRNNLSVIAFINKKGSTALTHEILNVQKVRLGQNQNWD